MIAEEGAELVLHGHLHSVSLLYVDGKHGQVPVVGVPLGVESARQTGPRPPSTSISISGTPGDFTCEMTSIRLQSGRRDPAGLIDEPADRSAQRAAKLATSDRDGTQA